MTEAEEIAKKLREAWDTHNYLYYGRRGSLQACAWWVRSTLSDASETTIKDVAEALHKGETK
jgi:hypothetical protein